MPAEQDLSFIKDRIFPGFFVEQNEKFVKFVELWLDWQSQRGNSYWNLSNLENFTSIDDTVEEFYKLIRDEYTMDFPDQVVADSKTFLKNVVHIYRTKGIEECYRLIFRVFWGVDIKITYPYERIFRNSDNTWIQEKFITTVDLPFTDLVKLPGCLIYGMSSETTAVVKNLAFINVIEGDEFPSYVMTLEKLTGDFLEGETVRVIGGASEMHGVLFSVEHFADRPGYWESTASFCSTDKVLQDNYYYQDFSYVVTTTIPIYDWFRLVTKLLHPAGMKIFGRYVISLGGDTPAVITPEVILQFKLWILKMTDWLEASVLMSRAWKLEIRKFLETQVGVLRKFVRCVFHEFETGALVESKSHQITIVKELISGVEYSMGWQRVMPHSEASAHKLGFPCDISGDYSEHFILRDFASKTLMDMDRRLPDANELVFFNGKQTRALFQ